MADLHSEVRVSGSVQSPLRCVPPTLGLASHSAAGLRSGFGLCCRFGLQAHFVIPLFIQPSPWLQLLSWISLLLGNGPATLGPAFASLCTSCPRFGFHFGIGIPPSFWRPLLSGSLLLMVRPLTLVSSYALLWATTLSYLASQPCIGLKCSVGLNSPYFVLPPQFQPPICDGLWLSPFWPPAPVSASSQLQVSLVRLSTCPLVFYPQFGLHSAMGLPPSFWSPVFILAFPLQQSSTLVLVSHSTVGFPCLGQPLLCGQTPMLDLASTLVTTLPRSVQPPTLPWAFYTRFSLTCCIGPQFSIQPPMLSLVSTLCSASHAVSGLQSAVGLLLLVWPLSPWWSCPLCLASAPLWASPCVPPQQFQQQGKDAVLRPFRSPTLGLAGLCRASITQGRSYPLTAGTQRRAWGHTGLQGSVWCRGRCAKEEARVRRTRCWHS